MWWTFQRRGAEGALRRPGLRDPGQNATVTGRDENGFTFSDEQKGSQVDLVKTLESVRQLLSQKRAGIFKPLLLRLSQP